jgi:hypothetical protein
MKGCFIPTCRATIHSKNQSCSFLDSTAVLGILREVFPKQLCEFSENSLFWSSFASLLRECWGNSSFWSSFVNSGGILLCLVVWFQIAVEILENGLGVNWKWKSHRKRVLVGGEGQRSNAAKWELEKVLLLAQKTVQETFCPVKGTLLFLLLYSTDCWIELCSENLIIKFNSIVNSRFAAVQMARFFLALVFICI